MKVTVSDNQSQQEKEIKFPLLAKNINSGTIAYFISEHIAVILDKGESKWFKKGVCETNLIGIKSDDWEILPKGVTITLEND